MKSIQTTIFIAIRSFTRLHYASLRPAIRPFTRPHFASLRPAIRQFVYTSLIGRGLTSFRFAFNRFAALRPRSASLRPATPQTSLRPITRQFTLISLWPAIRPFMQTSLRLALSLTILFGAATALQAQSTQTQPSQSKQPGQPEQPMQSGQPSMPQSRTSAFAKSPLDMCYYPADYPVLRLQDKPMEPLVARVVYSRPQKQGRRLFGDLVEYGKVWRLGANEATEIEFFRDVKIDNKKVKKGRYTLYALVEADKWTLILNKDTDTWGAFRYDQSKDVVRVSQPVEKSAEVTEAFYMQFQKVNKGAALFIYWDDVMVKLPIAW